MKYFTLLILLLFVGCGGQVGVTGKVTFKEDGKPLTKGTVVFTKPLFMAGGVLNENGEYTLSSYKPGDGTQKGEYQVYITGAEEPSDKEGEMPKPLINEKFTSPETSGLKCTVSGATTFDITVEKVNSEQRTVNSGK